MCLNRYSFFIPFHKSSNEANLWMQVSKWFIRFNSLFFGVLKKDRKVFVLPSEKLYMVVLKEFLSSHKLVSKKQFHFLSIQ